MAHPRADEILAEAKTWLGVPYKYLGRSRAGVDCVGLPLVVAKALGITNFDTRSYGMDPSPRALLNGLAAAGFTFVREGETGDLPVLKVQGSPRHVAILERTPAGVIYLLHAWHPAQKVIREPYIPERYGRLSLAYRFPGG